MNTDEYKVKELVIKQECENKLHELRMSFINENAEFKVGDYIGNVTGIIKISRIGYKLIRDIPNIIYNGYRYKKVKGILSRTKDKKISQLGNYSLKLVK